MNDREPDSPFAWARSAGLVPVVLNAADREAARRRRRHRRLASALAVVAFLTGGSSLLLIDRTPASAAVRGSAFVALPARQALPDGSTVELREGAEIAVAFSPSERRVVLHRGEAHFQVASNPQRPFVVRASGIDVRAVGTAFSVQLGAQAVAVVVTEGRVAVDGGNAPLTLDAGHGATVETPTAPNESPRITAPVALPAEELATRLAWRVPRLEFSDTPLAEALALFNRHSATRLTLGDARLGRLQISGIVRADNTDALLRLLWLQFQIEPETGDTTTIVLRRAR